MLHLARTVVFSLSSLFALIVLGLAANNILFLVFSILAIITAGFTIVTLPVMLIIDAKRSGVFTSMIFTELVTLFVLWVLWLATAAWATNTFVSPFEFEDSCRYYIGACGEFKALIAFSHLTWILLMVYYGVLLVMGFIGANRGQRTWTTSVKEAGFFSPGPRYAAAPSNNSASMQQQQYHPTNATTPSAANRVMV
ncbi:hypothetical protein FIBSPDRAFT_501683 [Athelia psychrophila]|uniref:MARVEL domain-containing protein n=1 Tax=Athelia psychrophila TaxID=1759441 RepID=A0A166KD12_9AGAM|nr:hypothetical protein FIBSPDRAFT_501683 [Fibularhizoctonia sp. CBS 109695]